MRGHVWVWAVAAAATILSSLAVQTRAADGPPRRPVTVGILTLNASHVVAVYRPVEHQAVAVMVARPGQAVQTIVITDVREAATVFDALWKDDRVTKNPGDADARPLTRMMVRGAEEATATLIVNAERVLAVRWDPNRRTAAVYLDVPAPAEPLADPNTGRERDHLEIPNGRRQAEAVLEAYKACVLAGGRDNR